MVGPVKLERCCRPRGGGARLAADHRPGRISMSSVLDDLSGLRLTEGRAAHFEFLLQTVRTIIRSSKVEQFQIGVTGKPFARRRAYARWCDSDGATLGGFVALDWGRTAAQICDTERWLFHRLEPHSKYPKTLQRRYYPSVARHLDNQFIYLAWWSWS